MTKVKSTKKALLLSVLSMLVCIAMLAGSTFAWFTDNVTSGKNRITAGNLDVELYHSNSTVTNESVDGATNLFTGKDGESVIWEPGVMVYENFKVVNKGSLALKYQMKINVDDFNTVGGKSLKDVLKVAILDKPFSGDRNEALALTYNKTVVDFEEDGNLPAGSEEAESAKEYAVVIYWQPSANDNDYNLNNGKVSSDGNPLFIDLGVNLVAHQDNVESDSFNKDYDKTAWPYPTKIAVYSDLQNVFKSESINAKFVNDISYINEATSGAESRTNVFLAAANSTADVDFNGNKLIISSASGQNGVKAANGATLTLSNGTIEQNKATGSSYPVIGNEKGTIVLNKMTVVNSDKDGITVSAGSDGGVIEIYGSTIEGGEKYNDAVFCGSQSYILINGSTVIGCIRTANNCKIEINGGDYTQATFDSQYKYHIIVYNGLFSFDPSTSTEVMLADPDNTYVTDNGNGTWSVATLDEGDFDDPFGD